MADFNPLQAGIPVVGGLLGGLFSAAAEKKRQAREQAAKMQEQATNIQIGAAQQLSQGEMNALQNLQQAYQRSLGL